MKLDSKTFKRFKELETKINSGSANSKETSEYEKLSKLRGSGSKGGKSRATSRSGSKQYTGNDIAWLNKYPEIMQDASNMRANWLPGTDLLTWNGSAATIPGVVKITMLDIYGSDTSVTDPLNVAARELYLKMFQKYRGISSYEAADVAILLVAGIEVIKHIAQLERIYGIINRWDRTNYNMPETELAALGINTSQAQWLRAHLSDYRYELNILINKAQRICVPNDMAFLKEKIALYGAEYLDHGLNKAQIILFDTPCYGVYYPNYGTGTDTLSAGSVVFQEVTNMSSNPNTSRITQGTGNMFGLLNAQIEALVGNEDVQRIFGDFLAWFGAENMITAYAMPADYVVTPVEEKSILHKIHNLDVVSLNSMQDPNNVYNLQAKIGGTLYPASMTGTPDENALFTMRNANKWAVFQYGGTVYSKPMLGYGASNGGITDPSTGMKLYVYNQFACINCDTEQQVLDSYSNDWNEEIVVEGVLWKTFTRVIYDSVSQSWASVVEACGPEICVGLNFYLRHNNGGTTSYSGRNYINGTTAFLEDVMVQGLDWAPIVYDVTIDSSDEVIYQFVFGDLCACRVVTPLECQKIDRAAIMSLFKSDIQPQR